MIISPSNNFYNFTKEFEKNTMLNRGALDIFGIWLPWSIMANNNFEKKERFIKSGSVFLLGFLAPLLTIPFFNRLTTSLLKVSPNFKSNQSQIIQLSNQYLRDSSELKQGIETLGKTLNIDFSQTLGKFSNLEELRKKIINAKNIVLGADLLLTGTFLGGNAWLANWITKKNTGKTGFSAEFSMADQKYIEEKAKNHERNKHLKMLITFGLVAATSFITPFLLKKAILSPNPTGLLKKIKDNATKFDYTKGIYMKRLPLFIGTMVGGHIGYLLASRDSHERKDTAIRLVAIDSLFYGGDYLLNSVLGKLLDKFSGTKLVNQNAINIIDNTFMNKLKKIFPPINSIEDIENMIKLNKGDLQTLTKTKSYAVKLYWTNFLLIVIALGFGTPKVLNMILKKDVKAQQDNFLSNTSQDIKPNNIQKSIFTDFEQKIGI